MREREGERRGGLQDSDFLKIPFPPLRSVANHPLSTDVRKYINRLMVRIPSDLMQ